MKQINEKTMPFVHDGAIFKYTCAFCEEKPKPCLARCHIIRIRIAREQIMTVLIQLSKFNDHDLHFLSTMTKLK